MRLILLVAVLVSVSLLASPIAAQTDTTTPEPEPDCPEPESITSDVDLCSADLDGDTALLTFRSDATHRATLVDAGAFMQGGEIHREHRTLRGDDLTTIRFPVTTVDGFAGVSVDVDGVLYAIPLKHQSHLIGPPWTATDAQIAALGGAASVGLVSIALAWRRITEKDLAPERVA